MRNLIFMVAVLFIFTACKKEKRINHNLWKGDGEWNIELMKVQTTSSYYESDNYSNTEVNAGTMKFNKDGSGVMTLKDNSDNTTYSYSFTYTNTEDQLTITDEDGEGVIYSLDWSKNEFTITYNSSEVYSTSDGAGGTVDVHFTEYREMQCKKK